MINHMDRLSRKNFFRSRENTKFSAIGMEMGTRALWRGGGLLSAQLELREHVLLV